VRSFSETSEHSKNLLSLKTSIEILRSPEISENLQCPDTSENLQGPEASENLQSSENADNLQRSGNPLNSSASHGSEKTYSQCTDKSETANGKLHYSKSGEFNKVEVNTPPKISFIESNDKTVPGNLCLDNSTKT